MTIIGVNLSFPCGTSLSPVSEYLGIQFGRAEEITEVNQAG
jgi:hypothetical protein